MTIFDYYNADAYTSLDIDVLYISGGNTFATMKRLREVSFDQYITQYIRSGVTYIGGSAGAHIVSASIAHLVGIDECPEGMTNVNGLGLLNGILICHYGDERRTLYQSLKTDGQYPVYTLTDDDSIVITEQIRSYTMIFESKQIQLKHGITATLRTPEVSEAADMLAYIKQACGETDFLLRYADEWDGTTVEQEETWVKCLRASENTLAITCFIDGRVAGNCEISFLGDGKTAHRANVSIAILKPYWNLGLGTAMFCEMTAAAQARGTEIMELEFIEGNDRARHLYEKCGFRVVCEKPRAFKHRDGTYRSEFQMQKYL